MKRKQPACHFGREGELALKRWTWSFCYSEEEFAREPILTDQTKHRDGETRATFMRSVTQAPGAAGKEIRRWKRGPSSIFHVHVAFISAHSHEWQTIKTAQRRGGNPVAAQMTPAAPDGASRKKNFWG